MGMGARNSRVEVFLTCAWTTGIVVAGAVRLDIVGNPPVVAIDPVAVEELLVPINLWRQSFLFC